MKLLTIGIDRAGSTSHHRRLTLERLLPDFESCHIDTWIPFSKCSRVSRSVAFRFHSGPVIKAINRGILDKLELLPAHFDLVWIDKAVFLELSTIRALRERAGKLIHYTPDTAFLGNRSRHFNRSGSLYDLLVTTKSFEMAQYEQTFPGQSIHLSSQGYHADIHRPLVPFPEKRDEVAFAGLAEPDRFAVVKALLDAGLPVRLAGFGWKRFVEEHSSSSLTFVGDSISGEDYARFLSSALFSPGLVSKNFPELHTTRTFEIPACGTALLTERNAETSSFFSDDEAIFFGSLPEMIERIRYFLGRRDELERISEAGRRRVEKDGRSYDGLLGEVIAEIGLL